VLYSVYYFDWTLVTGVHKRSLSRYFSADNVSVTTTCSFKNVETGLTGGNAGTLPGERGGSSVGLF
jgi:hypothetical protein